MYLCLNLLQKLLKHLKSNKINSGIFFKFIDILERLKIQNVLKALIAYKYFFNN